MMEREYLYRLIRGGENEHVEYKDCSDRVPGSFYETVVSFSNTDGGIILLGVDDNTTITGISEEAETKLKKDIVTALNSPDCIEPPVYIQPESVSTEEGLIIAVHIPASSQVHNHKGIIYVRDFESDIDISKNQKRLTDLYHRKQAFYTETQIYPGLSMDDLEPALFDKARKLIKANRSDHPWLTMENEQLLKASILHRKDFQSGEEGLTLAAALIFGKDETIQSLLPAYKVEGMVRIENQDRWDDRITLRTNLIDTYQQLKQFIYRHLPEKFYMEGDQRVDVRDVIFREVIGNAIVHREYTSALSTDLTINRNEVTITNPNKALFHGPIDPQDFNPYPKNPNIRKFFTSFGWTDEIGSGIRNTTKWLPRYVPNAKPVFIEDDVFRTIIPLRVEHLANFAGKWRSWLKLPNEAENHLKEGLKGVPLSSDLLDSEWPEVILQLVPGWHQKGTRLKALGWPQKQVMTPEAIQEVPGWYENGTKLLHKKTHYYIQILFLTSKPIALDEMMQFMGYSNRAKFRGSYLEPLEQLDLVTKTIPEVPSSPDQKYRLTEKGKLFLGDDKFELK